MKKLISIALIAVLCTLCALCFVGCKDNDSGLTKVRLNEVTHSVFYISPKKVSRSSLPTAEERTNP